MLGPVICGVEDSATSTRAIEVARELAGRFEAPLLFVHVTGVGHQDTDAALELRRSVASSDGLDVAAMTETGHPADRLVELAAEREASFLVVGCHGPRSSLLGSISADVSRRASCPVVVVPVDARGPRDRRAVCHAFTARSA